MTASEFEQRIQHVIYYALDRTRMRGFEFRVMNRIKPVAKNSRYSAGHTSLKNKIITIDVYTARLRKPKKISAILLTALLELPRDKRILILLRDMLHLSSDEISNLVGYTQNNIKAKALR